MLMCKNVVSISKCVRFWQRDCKLKSLKGVSLFLNFSFKCKRYTRKGLYHKHVFDEFSESKHIYITSTQIKIQNVPSAPETPSCSEKNVFFF